MGKVFIEMTISLDGYSSKKDLTLEHPFGVDGDKIHDWMFDKKTPKDEELIKEFMGRTGAVIGGKTTYELGIDGGWEGKNPFPSPFFILTHEVPTEVPEGFTFVTEGIENALAQAQKVAGEKDVLIMGGPNVARQYLKAGLVDEVVLHIVPLIFGEGISLLGDLGVEINLEHIGEPIQTPGATHVKYKVL